MDEELWGNYGRYIGRNVYTKNAIHVTMVRAQAKFSTVRCQFMNTVHISAMKYLVLSKH